VLTPYEQEMLAGKTRHSKRIAMERLVKFAEGMGSKRMVPICSAHLFDDHQSRDYTVGAWPHLRSLRRWGQTVVVLDHVESTAMGDDLVDDEGMPWHYAVMASARAVYKGMIPVHEKPKKDGCRCYSNVYPVQTHLAPPKLGEYLVTSESNAAAYSNIMNRGTGETGSGEHGAVCCNHGCHA
jgi:predicted aconitase